jgi:RNA polymerase sigma-70 factor (ECF subfamily)
VEFPEIAVKSASRGLENERRKTKSLPIGRLFVVMGLQSATVERRVYAVFFTDATFGVSRQFVIIRGMDLEQERELVERARSSAEAFGELYDMYYDQIFGYALRRSASLEVAQDVTSTVFYEALRHIKSYRWRGVPFSHWLFRIAGRELADQSRKNKREVDYVQQTQEMESERASAKEELSKHEAYLDLQRYVARLPARYQEVITLKYFEDKDIQQIASILGKPGGTVKSLLHRGIEQLRKMMESEQ